MGAIDRIEWEGAGIGIEIGGGVDEGCRGFENSQERAKNVREHGQELAGGLSP